VMPRFPMAPRIIKALVKKLAHAPTIRKYLRAVYHAPVVKGCLKRLPLICNIYPIEERSDAFDSLYGVDTGGIVPVERLHPDRSLTALIKPYVGSKPSAVRGALAALGHIEDYALIDLGCGKGRAGIIGSEFPFREIIGIELSAKLVNIARSNANVIARTYPDRPAITIHQGNAVEYELPAGKLVLFLYHSFGRELFAQLLAKLEFSILSQGKHLFFVYNNPVCGDILDGSPAFTRWWADVIPHEPSEMAYRSSGHENVVVWQSISAARPTPHQRANRRIVITDPLWRAELEDAR
jgi:SAM-dependent methyltransferase